MKRFAAVALVLGGILVGACVAPQIAPRPSIADTQTNWEYRVVDVLSGTNTAAFSKLLNDAAVDGWELHQKDSAWLIFKRTKH